MIEITIRFEEVSIAIGECGLGGLFDGEADVQVHAPDSYFVDVIRLDCNVHRDGKWETITTSLAPPREEDESFEAQLYRRLDAALLADWAHVIEDAIETELDAGARLPVDPPHTPIFI